MLAPKFAGALRMEDIMNIRQEQLIDYAIVYQVVKKAFENAEHSDGNEQDLVARLKNSISFIPELSLVAVEENRIVGHILFTKAFVNDVEVLALAPLSVLPEFQNRGIGLSLIKQGHRIASHEAFCQVLFWLLTKNFSVGRGTGRKKGRTTLLWTFRSRFRGWVV